MAHLGVLEVLEENKIPIDILVGCSSGAIVAAAYACGRLKELNEIALTLQKKDLRRILDFWLTGEGLIKGRRLRSLFDYLTAHKNFSDIRGVKLAFVGTDALTGKEVIIEKGNIAAALEVTTALPGLAALKRYEGKLVFDGGTAMLVPAKAAYDLGADKVIAVDVSVKRSLVTRTVGDFRKLMRSTRLGKMAKPVFLM
jgi:NTE family protein